MLDLLFSDSRAYVQDIVAWSICIAALVFGAGPERAVALVWIVLFEFLAVVYHTLTPAGFVVEQVDPFYAMIDACALIAWVSVALYANRNYILWIAAMQLLAMTAHVARGLIEAIAPLSYVIMVAVPGWVQLFLLAAGVSRHLLRMRRHGQYRDWRIHKPRMGMGSGGAGGLALQNELAWRQAGQPSWRDDLK